jgi:hypothetical protein
MPATLAPKQISPLYGKKIRSPLAYQSGVISGTFVLVAGGVRVPVLVLLGVLEGVLVFEAVGVIEPVCELVTVKVLVREGVKVLVLVAAINSTLTFVALLVLVAVEVLVELLVLEAVLVLVSVFVTVKVAVLELVTVLVVKDLKTTELGVFVVVTLIIPGLIGV